MDTQFLKKNSKISKKFKIKKLKKISKTVKNFKYCNLFAPMRLNNYLLRDDTHSLANCDQLVLLVSETAITMDPDWLHSDELGQSEWDCPVLFQDIQDIDKVLRIYLMLIFIYFNVYFT